MTEHGSDGRATHVEVEVDGQRKIWSMAEHTYRELINFAKREQKAVYVKKPDMVAVHSSAIDWSGLYNRFIPVQFHTLCDPSTEKRVDLYSKIPKERLMDRGFVWAPYIPVQKPVAFKPESFENIKGVMTRYAQKILRQDYYGTVNIPGLGELEPQALENEHFRGTIEFPVIKNVIPGTIKEMFELDEKGMLPLNAYAPPAVIADPSKYPHQCPRCSAPAYIGLMSVDCSRKSCS